MEGLRIRQFQLRTTPEGVIISFLTPFSSRVDELNQKIKNSPDKEFQAVIEPIRKKRSLSANAYYHVLVRKMAKKLRSTETEVHNHLLGAYGEPEKIGEKVVTTLIPDGADYLKSDVAHLRPTDVTEERKGTLWRWFYVMKPSHKYDSIEMARLIDGAVSEAKDLDIETLTPNELERMKSAWKGT